jgi:pimeloyl-ACP methyl ester carboxylesterase
MAAAAPNSPIDGMAEHILPLPLPSSGQIAYAHNGNPSSRLVVVFFPGLFSVGTAKTVPAPLRQLDAHWISPTLPGMGNTSSTPPNTPYRVNLAQSLSALLDHLHPDGLDRVWIAGGSYGTVAAQMIYGAPYDIFPQGRQIAGCMILAGFSPFKYHKDYSRSLIWPNWVIVGPPSQLVPFRLVQRLISTVFARQLATLDGALSFLRSALFDKMDPAEQAKFDEYLAHQGEGETKDDFIRNMAGTVLRSVKNWDGFMEVSDAIHSDWGFKPDELDEQHASKPVLVVGGDQDELGNKMNEWMVNNYKNAKGRTIPGGHVSALFYQDELWAQLLEMTADK